MQTDVTFFDKVGALKADVHQLEDILDKAVIDDVALRLAKINFSPPFTLPVSNFLHLTRHSLFEEIERTLSLKASEIKDLGFDSKDDYREEKLQHIAQLVYYFKQLTLLRQDDSEAWDEIDELYIHD